MRLEGPNLCIRWYGKIDDFVRYAVFDRLFSRKPKIIVAKVRPSICRHIDVFPQNTFGSLVEKIGGSLNRIFIRCLVSSLSSTNHKCSVSAYLARFGTQVGDDGYGGNDAHVVQGEVYRKVLKEIVETYTFANASSCGLK